MTDEAWKDRALEIIDQLAARDVEITADAVRACGLGEPEHHSHWGAMFKAARAAGLIVPVGVAHGKRRARRGGLVRTWRRPDAEAPAA